MASCKHPDTENNPDQRRIALTLAYLEVICPDIDHSRRIETANSILSVICDIGRRLSQKKITDSQAVEMVWRNSQRVRNQTGKCPLLVFGRQLANELNEFFTHEERSGDDF